MTVHAEDTAAALVADGPWALILTVPGAKREIVGRFHNSIDAADYLDLSATIDNGHARAGYYTIVRMTAAGEPNIIVHLRGKWVDFYGATVVMDPDLREALADREWTSATPEQDFLDAYCALHLATFDEEFSA
jgi:hypothetical protein